MAASHYAYNTLEMPGALTIITAPSDKKDALICVDQLYREAVAATAAKALALAAEAPGRSQPKGKVTLPVTFGGELNYRTERIAFDVAEIPLPYNGILGRPALAKFMAALHYAYNTLKMPGPMTIITVP